MVLSTLLDTKKTFFSFPFGERFPW